MLRFPACKLSPTCHNKVLIPFRKMERAKGFAYYKCKSTIFSYKANHFPQKIMDLQDFGVIMNYLQIFLTNKWHKGNHRITPSSGRAIKML